MNEQLIKITKKSYEDGGKVRMVITYDDGV